MLASDTKGRSTRSIFVFQTNKNLYELVWRGLSLTSANVVKKMSQLSLEFAPLEQEKPPYSAIYFFMGMYNSDDQVPQEIMGFDCPFDDSPVIEAPTVGELTDVVLAAYQGESSKIEEDVFPEVIVDSEGTIRSEIYNRIFPDSKFNPDEIRYSGGRETLTQFWEREKYRWFPES